MRAIKEIRPPASKTTTTRRAGKVTCDFPQPSFRSGSHTLACNASSPRKVVATSPQRRGKYETQSCRLITAFASLPVFGAQPPAERACRYGRTTDGSHRETFRLDISLAKRSPVGRRLSRRIAQSFKGTMEEEKEAGPDHGLRCCSVMPRVAGDFNILLWWNTKTLAAFDGLQRKDQLDHGQGHGWPGSRGKTFGFAKSPQQCASQY